MPRSSHKPELSVKYRQIADKIYKVEALIKSKAYKN